MTNQQLSEDVDEIAFFIGTIVREQTASIVKCFFDVLAEIKCFLSGEKVSDTFYKDIVDLTFMLGGELDYATSEEISKHIYTLSRVKNAYKMHYKA